MSTPFHHPIFPMTGVLFLLCDGFGSFDWDNQGKAVCKVSGMGASRGGCMQAAFDLHYIIRTCSAIDVAKRVVLAWMSLWHIPYDSITNIWRPNTVVGLWGSL